MLSLELTVSGQVQGVGFRPFVYRQAIKFKLDGWVKNCSGEVIILLQGSQTNLKGFQHAILDELPPLAKPVIKSTRHIDSPLQTHFSIHKSALSQNAERHIPADYFTCNDCLDELNHPHERRYRYPFINCTQCGPRYTIIYDLPYDRPNTSMKQFPLCPACDKEYSNVLDRRFHAQPLACAECGPELQVIYSEAFSDKQQSSISGNEAALEASVSALKKGKIIAVKGIGGYHLICDASNELAVQELRKRKQRPHKPLAIMFSAPTDDPLQQLNDYCSPDNAQAAALMSPQRPIVLIRSKKNHLAEAINPGLNEVGAMLAYSPLHSLLLNDFGSPIVATSGNISGEPVLIDNQTAYAKLHSIADLFLHHNRQIIRPADDSVIRIIHNKHRLLRIGRGLAPLEINLPFTLKHPVLALGGQMKNTIALAWGHGDKSRVVISPHIGELKSQASIATFKQVIEDFCQLYQITPQQVICDQHPDYYSTRFARNYAEQHHIPLTLIQHHHAHAAIVYGEYHTLHKSSKNPWLMFSWDGTGLGDDQTIWGGEAFYGQPGNWQRICSIKPFFIQGGDKVATQPWRSACALLWEKDEWSGDIEASQHKPDSLSYQAWKKRINTHQTSSMGRLFDAASALLGLGDYSSFDGQGAMLLEALLDTIKKPRKRSYKSLALYEVKTSNEQLLILADWSELLSLLLNKQQSIEQRALDFHHQIAETLVAQAKKVRDIKGNFHIGLSGGVFQNKYLVEYLFKRLEEEGFSVFLPEKVPYNDAGLAFGQIIEAIGQKI